jgi:hypothetical protein
MKLHLPLFAVCSLALAFANPVISSAQETPQSRLDALFNDEAVKALLDEAEPDTAFLARIRMMRAHLSASENLTGKGIVEEALQHIKHPRSEIYPEIEAALLSHKMTEIGNLLDKLEAAFAAGNIDGIQTAMKTVNSELDRAEAVIDPASLANGRVRADAASLLLRTAVVEYHRAFEFSKLKNMVEYHDGAFFVNEARSLLDLAEPAFKKNDPESLAKLQDSFGKLEKAWPAEAPPAELVMPVTKMQALVSIIELQLNQMK